MIKIALTGNIASGKSEVEKILRDMNFTVIDTDKINHDLLAHDENTILEIKSAFNNFDITNSDGNLSKEKIANIVFRDKEKRKILENILHTKISDKLNEIFDEKQNEEIIFVAVPLLFEVNWENKFDKILFISADENIRLQRLIKRNNLTVEQAQSRINAQMHEQKKINKSDFVIKNNSDFETLKTQTIKVLNTIISR